ncbi:MAG: antibiotic biosynthesis monooxygenase [Thermomicrobia bacterium]|nr:antibiotic biosynthesis monooxygenase [Thermomicrobia bacterium]MCA1723192.1 antibiotic biosynthesis monooxygenase [Thermomicrobia bacterium]
MLAVTTLTVRSDLDAAFEAAFATAAPIIATANGYLAHELHRCVEASGIYLLFVRWRTMEDHIVGFRHSPEYAEWRGLLDHFYGEAPLVQHFSGVAANEARSALPVG